MTTQHASELLAELLQNLMDVTGEPPEANCSCHLSPPCSDCVDYGSWREVFSACQSAIARATLVAPSTSSVRLTVKQRENIDNACASMDWDDDYTNCIGAVIDLVEAAHNIKGGA